MRPEDALVSSLSALACARPGDACPHVTTAISILQPLLSAECAELALALMDFMAFLLLSLVALIFKPHQFVATTVVFQDGEKVTVVSAAAQKEVSRLHHLQRRCSHLKRQ